MTALRAALENHPPEIRHSDQGIQYAAYAYIDLLKEHGIQISITAWLGKAAAVGKAEENGYAERFMRTIKEEEVDLSEYLDFADAAKQIGGPSQGLPLGEGDQRVAREVKEARTGSPWLCQDKLQERDRHSWPALERSNSGGENPLAGAAGQTEFAACCNSCT